MRERTKNVLAFLGVGMLFAHSCSLYWMFLEAYYNDYELLIAVNNYNEANIEFVMIPVTLIWGFYGILHYMQRLRLNKHQ